MKDPEVIPPLDRRPILLLSTVHAEGWGAERVLNELLRAWSGQNPLALIAPLDSRAAAEARDRGWPVFPLATTRDACVKNARALWSLSSILPPPALVHAWHSRGFEQAWLLGKRLKCPVTGTVHDHPRAFFHSAVRRWLIRHSARRMDGWVAVSEAVARVVEACGFPPRGQVIRNGLAEAPRMTHPPRVIGFLGMNSIGKGFDRIARWIDATPDLEWRWHLYGQPAPEWAFLAADLVRRYPDRVQLMGRCPPERIFTEIGLVVHASTAFESYGMVLAEAARAGLPVVASRMGGTPEVVVDGETGYLFDPERPDEGLVRLRYLLQDNEVRIRMGDSARHHFEKALRSDRMVREYSTFWQSILDRKGGTCISP